MHVDCSLHPWLSRALVHMELTIRSYRIVCHDLRSYSDADALSYVEVMLLKIKLRLKRGLQSYFSNSKIPKLMVKV